MTGEPLDVTYRMSPPVSDEAVNRLVAASWPDWQWTEYAPVLARSLAYVCAYVGECLIGYVNLAWDGDKHAFVLDTTVHPRWRRRGIGSALVERALQAARERGVVWVHVDYEPHLAPFYERCGFRPTLAGLMNLAGDDF